MLEPMAQNDIKLRRLRLIIMQVSNDTQFLQWSLVEEDNHPIFNEVVAKASKRQNPILPTLTKSTNCLIFSGLPTLLQAGSPFWAFRPLPYLSLAGTSPASNMVSASGKNTQEDLKLPCRTSSKMNRSKRCECGAFLSTWNEANRMQFTCFLNKRLVFPAQNRRFFLLQYP